MNKINQYGRRVEPRTKLETTIMHSGVRTSMWTHGNGEITIDGDLEVLTSAIEKEFVLTAKADLPKVTSGELGGVGVSGLPGLPGVLAYGSMTAESARKRANAWLAIAKHLEAKEAARAYEEAKAKAVAEAAAATAKQARLDDLADEWFGKDFAGLGPNKAAAINEIYRLETQLNTKDAA